MRTKEEGHMGRAFLCLITCLMFLVFNPRFVLSQNDDRVSSREVIDGHAWRGMDYEMRIVYLKGLRGGMYLSMNTTFSLQYLFEENLRLKKEVLKRMMIVNYIAVYMLLPQLESYDDVVDRMNDMYADAANLDIPAYEIYRVFTIESTLAGRGIMYKGQTIPFSVPVDSGEWRERVLSELRLRYGGG
jgi:hypothetical protein